MIVFSLLAMISSQPSLESRWAEAMALREDAIAARPLFAKLAVDYDRAWHENPQLATAQLRGQSHYLAGDLPGAIAAFRAGLRKYPGDSDLQSRLELCRAEVISPFAVAPPPKEWNDDMNDWKAFAVAVAAVLMVTVGCAKQFTSRERWVSLMAIIGLFALGMLAIRHRQAQLDSQVDADHPPHVLRFDAPLRTGNGETYAPRLPALLPLGSEVREVARRGGWVQIQLATGEMGWVPEGALLKVE